MTDHAHKLLLPKNPGVVGYTCGAFDLFHAQHVKFLEECKHNCDYLIVGLATDERIKEYKHPDRPIIPYEHRLIVLSALRVVDLILPDEEGPIPYLSSGQIDVYVKGIDWRGNLPTEETDLARSMGFLIQYITVSGLMSTTDIVEKVKGGHS